MNKKLNKLIDKVKGKFISYLNNLEEERKVYIQYTSITEVIKSNLNKLLLTMIVIMLLSANVLDKEITMTLYIGLSLAILLIVFILTIIKIYETFTIEKSFDLGIMKNAINLYGTVLIYFIVSSFVTLLVGLYLGSNPELNSKAYLGSIIVFSNFIILLAKIATVFLAFKIIIWITLLNSNKNPKDIHIKDKKEIQEI